MVKVLDSEDFDDRLRAIVDDFGFKLIVDGWSVKCYDIYHVSAREDHDLIARIDSNSFISGKVFVYDDRAFDFAIKAAELLEKDFESVKEASVVRADKPV